LAIFASSPICQELALKKTSTTTLAPTTTTVARSNATNDTNPLAPERLQSIKNSYSELNLLSKTKPSDFIFDFDKAVTGVSHGTGGRTVAATVSFQKNILLSLNISVLCLVS
jgi:hypothetical protein